MKTLKNLLFIGIIGLAGLGLSGCEGRTIQTITMQTETKKLNQEPQYSVKRVEVFADDFAYGGKRGIYEITDEQTKKKYLGVSGIGIIELDEISQGRATLTIER